MSIVTLFLLAFLSGVLGRMGGAKGYSTFYRDLGCPAIVIFALWLIFGFHPWVYLFVFLFQWASLTTYWDWLFGYDNLWFSGAIAGLAIFPIVFIQPELYFLVVLRGLLLCLIWGSLNKFLPKKIFVWKRAVVEEFSRYFVSL